MNQAPWSPDVLTTLATAATKTSTVRLGTSIVQTYPRHHPLEFREMKGPDFKIGGERIKLIEAKSRFNRTHFGGTSQRKVVSVTYNLCL